jgi:hypothetical protein
MKEPNEANRYHIPLKWHKRPTEAQIADAPDQELEKWAHDPNCIEMEECAKALAERYAKRESIREKFRAARAAKREELQDNPFDPRTEVSADAKHIAGRIVIHLWILFVLLPVIIGILLALAGVFK